jgi:hypothetical protein
MGHSKYNKKLRTLKNKFIVEVINEMDSSLYALWIMKLGVYRVWNLLSIIKV